LPPPVCTTHRVRQNVIEYFAKIEQAYTLIKGKQLEDRRKADAALSWKNWALQACPAGFFLKKDGLIARFLLKYRGKL